MRLENYNSIIFDMDGTLINSSDEVLSCLRRACEHLGVEMIEENFTTDIIGPPLEDIFRLFIVDKENDALVDKLTAEFKTIYDYDENDTSVMYENIYDWLISLKEAGKTLYLATNKFGIPTQRLLKKFKLDMFEDVYTIDKQEGKYISKQEMIEDIIKKYSLNKSETIMIGDATSDVKAAHSAGIQAVGVLWGYGSDKSKLKEISDFILELSELEALTRI